MNNKTDSYMQIIAPIIRQYLPHARIILYGSRVREDHHEGSDIDIAIDMGSRIPLLTMSKIAGDIEESIVPIPSDIVDLHAISQDIKKEIIKDGIVWKQD